MAAIASLKRSNEGEPLDGNGREVKKLKSPFEEGPEDGVKSESDNNRDFLEHHRPPFDIVGIEDNRVAELSTKHAQPSP
jgi:hypothetical protein